MIFPCPHSSNGPLVIDCNYCPAHDTSSSALTTISRSWLFTTDSRYADNGSTTRTEHVTEYEDHASTHKRPLVACTRSSTLLCLERRISISVMIAQQLIPLPVSTRSISVSPDCSNVRGQEHFSLNPSACNSALQVILSWHMRDTISTYPYLSTSMSVHRICEPWIRTMDSPAALPSPPNPSSNHDPNNQAYGVHTDEEWKDLPMTEGTDWFSTEAHFWQEANAHDYQSYGTLTISWPTS